MLRSFVRAARREFLSAWGDAEDEAALDAHIRSSSAVRARMSTLVLNTLHLLFWPLDHLLMVPDSQVLAAVSWLRWTTFLNHAALFVLLSLRPVARRPTPLLGVGIAVSSALVGRGLGRMGPLDQPYFYLGYLATLVMVGLPVRLPQRALMNALIMLSLAGGFFSARPSALASPLLGTALGYLLFAGGVSLILGHLLYLLERRAFLTARALARSQAVTSDLNDQLHLRVADQTRELRRLARHLSQITEDERRRMQRELHDEMGQQIAGIRFIISALQQRLVKEPQRALQKLSELDDVVGELQDGVRRLVSDLRPRVIDEHGLAAAVEWLLDTTRVRSGVACSLSLSVDDGVTLSPRLTIDAFRILQESLSNALRHAEPSSIRVELSIDTAAIDLCVADDGHGLRERGGHAAGMGIVGMRERARGHGGTLALEDAPGGGTLVRVRLPIAEGEAP
jgi:signal transduction histidine kinase